MFVITNSVSERAKMTTVCFVFVFAFAMKNLCASAQQYTVHACKDGTLRLNCRTGHIQVHSVIHGDSTCAGSSCCPRQNDCSGAPSATYRDQVNVSCDGQPSCSMNVEIRDIGCGFWAPRNDYTNITYSCVVTTTSPASTILTTTPFPTTLSSSSASTWQHTTTTTSFPIKFNTPPYTSEDKEATETEKEGDTTRSQSSLEGYTGLNLKRLAKTGKDTSGSEQGESESQVQTDQDKDYGYLDRINTLVAVIVAGVVITATVISVAVVLVLKKRRSVKIEEEHYDMPNYSCNANNDNEINVRNSNFYDTIPDPAGGCSARDSGIVECTTAKEENEYLKPVMERADAPYLWIP